MVFYGHSITQGACATRPGNAYPSILSRKYGFDFINLGFSGSAKGEDAMAEYIASLDMGAFVYDYDHNAPNAEQLLKTHEKMFKTIRKAHPSMPIVIMSTTTNEPFINEVALRRAVIYKTYDIFSFSVQNLISMLRNLGSKTLSSVLARNGKMLYKRLSAAD